MISFRRILFFLLLITALCLTGILVWWELIIPMQLTMTVQKIILVFFGLTLALLIWHLLRIHVKKPNPQRVFLTFGLAGLFIHLLCAALTKDVLVWIFQLFPYEKHLCRNFGVLAIGINFLGIYGALRGPLIKRVTLLVPQKHALLDGFRIAQISDLHIGPLIDDHYVSKVVQQTLQLQAHAIVLTGDIGDSDPDLFGAEAEPLKNLKASHGVYYVTGNHEYYWNAKSWIHIFEKLGMTALINRGMAISGKPLWLGGIADPDAGDFIPEHRPDAARAIPPGNPNDYFKILLAHQPKSCYDAEKAGFDLMLSGHTHGGQFFPFNFVVKLVNPYSTGLNHHGKMQVYVNQGTGFWGPALRLGVPAEITLFEFSAKSESLSGEKS